MLILMPAASARNQETYRNMAEGFELQYPGDWVVTENVKNEEFEVNLHNKTNPNMIFTISTIKSDAAEYTNNYILNNPAAMVEENKKKWTGVAQKYNGAMEFLGYELVNIGGKKGLYCHARVTGTENGEAVSLEFMEYCTAYRDKAYLIMIGCETAEFDKQSEFFRLMMNSFRIL